MKLILTAVPGAGKTQIMNFISEERPDIEMVHFGNEMFKIAKQRKLVNDKDDMRSKIPLNVYKEIQHQAANDIGEMKGNVVIDTHCSIKSRNGYYPGLPLSILNELKPDVILIREENKNVFIAECKFWHGQKAFGDAVDQMLGYLTWRDSKCALLIFNKTKDSNAVRQKKTALATFYVYVVFVVCFLPVVCVKAAYRIYGESELRLHLLYYSRTLVLLNSSLNPLIYCWKMRNFRQAVMSVLRNIFQSQ